MSVLESVIQKGEDEAKYGQRCVMTLTGLVVVDIILAACGVTATWLITIIGMGELIAFFGIMFFMFGTMSNIFAVSRASSIYNGAQVNNAS